MPTQPRRAPTALRIVASCILAAILYGIVHDLVTTHVCVEYFTIGHPRIFGTESPVLLALGWGVVATWWVGLLLGVPLGYVATRGPAPVRTARSLIPSLARLLGCMACVAAVAGIVGYVLAWFGWVVLVGPLASSVPEDRRVAFIADLWAHSASYLTGFLGGLVLVVRVRRARRNAASAAGATETSRAGRGA